MPHWVRPSFGVGEFFNTEGPHSNPNSVGPYYYTDGSGEPWAYFVFFCNDPGFTGNAKFVARRTQDGENFETIDFAGSPVYANASFVAGAYSVAHYVLGNRLYLATSNGIEGTDANGATYRNVDLWALDLVGGSWLLIKAADGSTPVLGGTFPRAGITTGEPCFSSPFNYVGAAGDGAKNCLLRVDESTGDVYLFHNGLSDAGVCPVSGTAFAQVTCGYTVFSATWGAFNSAYAVPVAGTAGVAAAGVLAGQAYAIVAESASDSGPQPCEAPAGMGTLLTLCAYRLYGSAPPALVSTPYVFNGPGTPPVFDDPGLVTRVGTGEFGATTAYPLPYNNAYRWASDFVALGADLVFSRLSAVRTLVLCKISAGVLTEVDTGQVVACRAPAGSNNSGGPSDYGLSHQVFVNPQTGSLGVIWRRDVLPFPWSWIYWTDGTCGPTTTFTQVDSSKNNPNFSWAAVDASTLAIGAVLTIDLAGLQQNSNTYSLMALVIPKGSGAAFATGSVTFATNNVNDGVLGVFVGEVPMGPVLSCPGDSGQLGVAYDSHLGVSGGLAPFTFALSGGALPPGLSLDTATGEITGTPTSAGSYGFTVTVTDAAMMTDDVTCGILILLRDLLTLTFKGEKLYPAG